MTGYELLLVLGGVILGFAVADAWYWLRRPVHRPKTVAEGWDQIRHVRVIKGGKQ
jgi:hypothetical protein